MPLIEIHNVGAVGIVKDAPAHTLPPEAWSDGQNFRFIDKQAYRMLGHTQVFGTPSVIPGFVFNVPGATSTFWLYGSKAAVYGYDAGVHTDITRAAGAYTAVEYRDWNYALLAGVPILNNGADVPQYWPTLSLATDLANLTNWPAALRAKVIRNYGRFLVALNLTESGTALAHAVQWSHPADPGSIPSSWDTTDATKDAGRTHLTDTHGGVLLDGLLLGNQLVLYKEESTHLMRFIGGQDIMGFDLLLNSGVLNTHCAALIDSGKRHFVVTPDDVLVHSGTRDVVYPLEGKDKRYLFNDIDATNYLNAFAFDNPAYEEAWFAYPTSGQTYPNKALVWNYRRDLVMFRDFEGLRADPGNYTDSLGTTWNATTGSWDAQTSQWATPGRRRIIVASPGSTKLFALDNGYAFGSSVSTAFLERTGLAIIGRDRQGAPKVDYGRRKLVRRIWPKLRGDATISVKVGAQEELDGALTYAAAKTFNASQKYLDFEVSGRLLAVHFSSQSDLSWQLEGYDLEVELLGTL